jgi:hypothetical protein
MYIAQADQVIISPSRLPQELKAHLDQFRLLLLDPKNIRIRAEFERQFDRGFE